MCLHTMRYIYKAWLSVSISAFFLKHEKVRNFMIYSHSCCLNVFNVLLLRVLSTNMNVYVCTLSKYSLEASGLSLIARESRVTFGGQTSPYVSVYWNAFTM